MIQRQYTNSVQGSITGILIEWSCHEHAKENRMFMAVFMNEFLLLRYTFNRTEQNRRNCVNRNVQRQLMILSICVIIGMIWIAGRKRTINRDGELLILKTASNGTETEKKKGKIEEQKEKEEQQQTGDVQVVIPGGDPNVRVLICADNYEGEYHDRLTLRCSTDYTVSYGDVREEHKASEPVWFTMDDPWLSYGTVTLTPREATGTFTLPDLKRGQKAPVYAGKFMIEKRKEGLLVINELPLETYLCSVVPSEMPAGYPMEALKAQAICARTYAMKQLQENREKDKGADLNDSVSYQVYNNIARNERTDQAVQETKGKVLMKGGNLIDALYFSTSCGLDLSENLSDEAVFCSLMSGKDEKAYEKEEPWYRWKTYYSLEELTRLVQSGLKEDFGAVTGMYVESREESGVIRTLRIEGEGENVCVEGEYAIRKLLQTQNAPVTLQDGSTAPDIGMLPSAFFYLTGEYEGKILKGYTLTGGGYGHGKGMSQNGARHMADAGMNCTDILRFYY